MKHEVSSSETPPRPRRRVEYGRGNCWGLQWARTRGKKLPPRVAAEKSGGGTESDKKKKDIFLLQKDF